MCTHNYVLSADILGSIYVYCIYTNRYIWFQIKLNTYVDKRNTFLIIVIPGKSLQSNNNNYAYYILMTFLSLLIRVISGKFLGNNVYISYTMIKICMV